MKTITIQQLIPSKNVKTKKFKSNMQKDIKMLF